MKERDSICLICIADLYCPECGAHIRVHAEPGEKIQPRHPKKCDCGAVLTMLIVQSLAEKGAA